MLHPSYSELMEAVNSRAEEGEQAVVQSRYSIVRRQQREQSRL